MAQHTLNSESVHAETVNSSPLSSILQPMRKFIFETTELIKVACHVPGSWMSVEVLSLSVMYETAPASESV